MKPVERERGMTNPSHPRLASANICKAKIDPKIRRAELDHRGSALPPGMAAPYVASRQ